MELAMRIHASRLAGFIRPVGMGALGLFLKKSICLATMIVGSAGCVLANEPYNLLNPVYLRVTRRSNTYTYINESPILFHPLLPYEGPSGE